MSVIISKSKKSDVLPCAVYEECSVCGVNGARIAQQEVSEYFISDQKKL